jgi:hypothetical protein
MGLGPPNAVEAWMRQSGKQICMNSHQIQTLNGTETCGLYALMQARELLLGKPFTTIVHEDLFPPNRWLGVEFNDTIVMSYAQQSGWLRTLGLPTPAIPRL